MEFKNQVVKCNKFWETESVIKKIEIKIQQARNNKEKRYYVQDILLETEALLSCADYNASNLDCLNCHSVADKYIKEYES